MKYSFMSSSADWLYPIDEEWKVFALKNIIVQRLFVQRLFQLMENYDSIRESYPELKIVAHQHFIGATGVGPV